MRTLYLNFIFYSARFEFSVRIIILDASFGHFKET